MKAFQATRAGSRFFGALALVASLGLVGCSDVDNALFGDDAETQDAATTPGTLDNSAAPAPQASRGQQPAQSQRPSYSDEAGTLPDQSPAMASPSPTASMSTMGAITPVQILSLIHI